MAGMFSTIFSSAGEGVQTMEDTMNSATNDLVAQGEAGAAQLDGRMQDAMDRGDAATDRVETVAAQTGNEIGNSLDASVGVHAEFDLSVHGETSGSYTDADGNVQDYGRSFDIGTGHTELNETLDLGATVGNTIDAAVTTTDATSDAMFDTM